MSGPYFRTVTRKVTDVEPDFDKLSAECKQYMEDNLICDVQYTFLSIEVGKSSNNSLYDVEVEFTGAEFPIDECFSPDDKFVAFLADLSDRYKCRVDYPWHYLPK